MLASEMLNELVESICRKRANYRKHPRRMVAGDVICVKEECFHRYGIWDGDNIILYGEADDGREIVHRESLPHFLKGAESYSICLFPKHYGRPAEMELPAMHSYVIMPPEKLWWLMEKLWKIKSYKRYSQQETLQRAISRLGQGGYRTSEHFAMWCKTGISESHQLNSLREIWDRIIVY